MLCIHEREENDNTVTCVNWTENSLKCSRVKNKPWAFGKERSRKVICTRKKKANIQILWDMEWRIEWLIVTSVSEEVAEYIFKVSVSVFRAVTDYRDAEIPTISPLWSPRRYCVYLEDGDKNLVGSTSHYTSACLQLHIPEDLNLCQHLWKNFKFVMGKKCWFGNNGLLLWF